METKEQAKQDDQEQDDKNELLSKKQLKDILDGVCLINHIKQDATQIA